MHTSVYQNKTQDISVTIRTEHGENGLREAIEYEYVGCSGKAKSDIRCLPVCVLGTDSFIYVCKKCGLSASAARKIYH